MNASSSWTLVPLYGTVNLEGDGRSMIESFRDGWLGDFFKADRPSKRIPADIADRLFCKLQIIDDATCDADLRAPPSNHFEKLFGSLSGFHSIRVNKQWRLVFRWDSSRAVASSLYLDNHDYR